MYITHTHKERRGENMWGGREGGERENYIPTKEYKKD
jgi:hypothetical protein